MRIPFVAFALLAACASTPAPHRRVVHRRARPRAATAAQPRTAPATFATTAPPLASPPTAARAATPTAATPTAAEPRCRELARRNEAALEAALAHEACRGSVWQSLRDTFAQCAQAGDGAWAAEVTGVHTIDQGVGVCRIDVAWRPTMFYRGGAVVDDAGDGRVGRAFTVIASGDEAQAITRLTLRATDFDNDGLPELTVVESSEDHAHPRDARQSVEVYAAVGGRVEVFGPTRAMALDDADDVDGDGRVDLVVPAPYAWTEGVECGMNVHRTALTMLAHALPGGGFSTTDDAAARYLRQSCPAPDAPPRARAAGDALDAEGLAVICQRLWGVGADEVLAALDCRGFRAEPSALCEGTRQQLPALQPGECPARYETWARATPPLRLR